MYLERFRELVVGASELLPPTDTFRRIKRDKLESDLSEAYGGDRRTVYPPTRPRPFLTKGGAGPVPDPPALVRLCAPGG